MSKVLVRNLNKSIRETEDKVEQIGVEKSMSYVQKADLILALFDTHPKYWTY